ncbi:nitrite reductase small subunit [Microbispora rosea subsp. aerata]|nr:nitrite reductase small subunit NirD [Microbispora rosea]GGO23834.1 nitrite reductase small subunit [Microbispora rosea subsp. aerata]GIH57779.1 nitrite reductase small subunit [Microbispora rosea subsp. aerata]GLJ84503.1 nitrite reductase small subunit [Microbispora rosea subsp. aerata]
MTVLDMTATRAGEWIPVCSYTDLLPERGAAVLVGGRQAAIFRTFDGALYALGNLDPFSGAQVMSRGIVGTRNGEPTVASPMHKQVFSLVTGVCLDDPSVALPTYPIRVTDGTVEVSVV